MFRNVLETVTHLRELRCRSEKKPDSHAVQSRQQGWCHPDRQHETGSGLDWVRLVEKMSYVCVIMSNDSSGVMAGCVHKWNKLSYRVYRVTDPLSSLILIDWARFIILYWAAHSLWWDQSSEGKQVLNAAQRVAPSSSSFCVPVVEGGPSVSYKCRHMVIHLPKK